MSAEQGYANPAALVSTDWVAEHLNDANVRLLEVDVDTTSYEGGHIQGAVGINWTTQLGDPIRRDIPSKEAWADLLGKAGASNDTRLIFYGDNNNWFAAFAYWVSKIYGHQNAALMNGGRKKWELENRAYTTEVASHAAATYTARDADLSLRAFLKDVLDRPSGVALVDVRSPAEFSGEVIAPPGMAETAQRAGHVPGAANIPWAQAANEDGTFKSPEELRALYGGKGVTRRRRHRLLPHRRALLAHLVRPEGAAGLPQRQELRRLVDRVRLRGRRPHRKSGPRTRQGVTRAPPRTRPALRPLRIRLGRDRGCAPGWRVR